MSTEIITDKEYAEAQLREHAETVNSAIDLIVEHEHAFQEATLEPCLLIGREIAKAQAIFGLDNHDRAKLGGDAKAALSRAVTKQEPRHNPHGFAAWLSREIPRLKRPTAIKYATCFKALDLPTEAPDKAITAKVKDLRHAAGRDNQPMPSLATLYKAAKPPKPEPAGYIDPATESGKSLAQGRLEDAREYFTTWREQGEKLINNGELDWLDKKGLEELKEFQGWLRDRLTARLRNL
jgi:hypothetical protein